MNASPLAAYHGDPSLKEKIIARVRMHRETDTLIRGTGWENGRGCAVGCALEKYDHKAYETELGVPEILARLEDCLFENLPNGLHLAWPERFLDAIKPGADLSKVWHHWVLWLLGDAEHGTMRLCGPAGAAATKRVIELYQKEIAGEPVTAAAWDAARAAAGDAARDAAWAAAGASHYVRMADKLIERLGEAK